MSDTSRRRANRASRLARAVALSGTSGMSVRLNWQRPCWRPSSNPASALRSKATIRSRPIFSPPSWQVWIRRSFTEETPEASAFRGGIVVA